MSSFHAPFPNFDEALMQKLRTELDAGQQLWLSGYLYGLSAHHALPGASAAVAPESGLNQYPKLTVLYGSQTGNCKSVAQKTAERAKAKGFEVSLRDMNEYPIQLLKTEQCLLVVVSTYGEGEPPAAAETLHQYLHSKRAPQLPGLQYAVLALGDRAYAQFCQTGIEFDLKLDELGAQRLMGRVDCDTDFHDDADRWIDAVLQKMEPRAGVAANDSSRSLAGPAQATKPLIAFDRKNPFPAPVLEKIQLSGRGSARENWHLELSIEGSGLAYAPGDALGIFPENPQELVHAVLEAASLSAQDVVEWKGKSIALEEALMRHVELSNISRDVLERLQTRIQSAALHNLLTDADAFRQYVYGRDIADVLSGFPEKWSADELFRLLRRLQPRLYSIASSQLVSPDEVHLTVSAVRYETHGRKKRGVASTWLADVPGVGDTAPVFVERNEYFKLPADHDTPILMIGPGTGVAPFRAFLQERTVQGASGHNWLLFGNPHFSTDFLYQTEWLQALKNGSLTRLDVAFSRDQPEKVYVQHKLLQHGREVYDWLERGAHVYVCGDKNRMAVDVQAAFREIVEQHGGHTEEHARNYVQEMKRQRRYLEDVY